VLRHAASAGGSGWLVLPGTSVEETTEALEANPRGLPDPVFDRDDTWYRAARLAVFDWTQIGSYPIRAPAVVH
jgi:hypothetical protein